MIKHVIFDIGKVLLDFEHRFMIDNLSRVSGESRDRIYRHIFGSPLFTLYESGRISSLSVYRQVSRKLRIRVPYMRFRKLWSDIFSRKPDVEAIVRSVRKNGCRTSILSNTNEMHYRYVREKYGILREFDRYFLSCRMKMLKPDKRIFRMIPVSLGTAPERCIYVDDIPENIDAAAKTGIKGIVFRGAGRLRTDMVKAGVIR